MAEHAGDPLPRNAPRTRRRLFREVLVAAVLVTIAETPFLISPRPPPERQEELCVRDFAIWGPLHITANCDAAGYLALANRPARMLSPDWPWAQNRPVYSVTGWALALPFRALGFGSLPARLLGDRVRPGSDEARYLTYGAEYAAYVLFNWLLLVASVLLLRRVLSAETILDTPVILPLGVLLVNEVTKAFFWTPHVQILNVLVPILSVHLLVWLQSRLPTLTRREVAAIGLVLGVASLMYGVFAMTVSAVVLSLLFGAGWSSARTRPAATISMVLVLLGSFFAPVAAWTALVAGTAGSFHSPETAQYRQFVWVADALAQSPATLLTSLRRHLTDYLATLPGVIAFPGLVLAAVTGARYALRVTGAISARERALGLAILLYMAANVAFYGLMGYYATRLTWTIVPAILLLIGLQVAALERSLTGRKRLALRVAVAGLALGHAAYWYARAGPYS